MAAGEQRHRISDELALLVRTVLDVDRAIELGGGHQSRVFDIGALGGSRAVAKVYDASMVERTELEVRVDVSTSLTDLGAPVCRPIDVAGRLIAEIAADDGRAWHVVCFERAAGVEPNPADATDAARMGEVLARLHAEMRRLAPTGLPVVHALRAAALTTDDIAQRQLLHGDFNVHNLARDGDAIRIFDLDDCGEGPPAFDVANALYMVYVDASVGDAMATYERFRPAFVESYGRTAGRSIPDETLDRFIDLRVAALAGWLDDLEHAPIGIRTSPASWRDTLREFVHNHRRV